MDIKSADPFIREISKPLSDGMNDVWDADDLIDDEYVLNLLQGRFVSTVFDIDKDILSWLVFFVARRALPCWETSCDDNRPRRLIRELGKNVVFGRPVNWSVLEQPIASPFNDCRYSDTQSASSSIAEAARYINQKDKMQAIYCISSADVAYDHVLTNDRYREWLISIAVPIAFEKREMTIDEMESLREATLVPPEPITTNE